MRISTVLCAAGCMALATGANAENWIAYSQSMSGTTRFIDMDSVRVSGSTRTFWDKSDHSKDASKKARETFARYRVDCSEETSTLLNLVTYDARGNVIENLTVPT